MRRNNMTDTGAGSMKNKSEGTKPNVLYSIFSAAARILRTTIGSVFRWIKNHKAASAIMAVLLFAAIGLAGALSDEQLLVTIGPGERGVIFNRVGGGVSNAILGEGTHFVWPVFQRVYLSRVSKQSASIERITADSKEFQDVALWLNIEFRISESEVPVLFREYGVKSSGQIIDDIITPNANEAAKVIIVTYPISEILTRQPEIKERLVTALRKILEPYHIAVIDIDLVNIRLAPEYREIVAKTEFASYERKQSGIRLETARMESERRIVEAETVKQEKIREAEGIAEYNRILSRQSISRELLEYRKLENSTAAIRKWNGALPGQIGNVSDWPF
jgi:regulator of protease activity HflC (stomatin/prohibitin superfamily)